MGTLIKRIKLIPIIKQRIGYEFGFLRKQLIFGIRTALSVSIYRKISYLFVQKQKSKEH